MASIDEKEKLLKRFKSDTRSVLISAPRGVLKRLFRKEYMSLIGSDLPLKQLGYINIDHFVRDNPDVVKEGIGPTGEPTFFVVANAETQHVASLVSRQKKPSLQKLRKASSRPRITVSRHMTSFSGRPVRRIARPIRKLSQLPTHTRFVAAGSEYKPRPLNKDNFLTDSTHSGIPPWKPEYSRPSAVFTSVSKVIESGKEHNFKIIAVTGYPGSHDRITQYPNEFRILLFDSYNREKRRLNDPILNVFFTDREWDVSKYPDPKTLPPQGGVRIKIWGILEYRFWKGKGDYFHSLRALYYRRLEETSPIMSSLKITAFKGSREVAEFKGSREVAELSPPTSQSPQSSPKSDSTCPDLGVWLKDILKDKENGLWARVALKMYQDKFNNEPKDFLTTIREFPFIKSEEIADGNPILYLKNDNEEDILPLPATIQLPELKWIDVLVVSMISPCHFYVQRLSEETSIQPLQELCDSMEAYFSQHQIFPPSIIEPDRLYAVCWEDGSTWCRTKILNNSADKVLVIYPDYGNQEYVERSQLRLLPSQFYKLPFQAVRCGLFNITNTSETATDKFEEIAFEKPCAAFVKERSDDCYSIELLSDNENVNEVIKNILYPIETLKPILPHPGSEAVGVVLRDISIETPGIITVHIQGAGTEKLNELSDLINDYHNKETSSNNELVLKEGAKCCGQYDNDWYRVQIEAIKDEKATIRFIDYGNIEEVQKSSLRCPVPHKLFQLLPPQAISCRLDRIPPPQCFWSEAATSWLYNYVDTELKLEMVSETECLLYYEEECLNDKMLNEAHLFSLATPPSSISSGRISPQLVADNYLLHSTVIRTDPQYVIVSHAVSPYDFAVQTCDNLEQYDELQEELQSYGDHAPTIELYQPGLPCLALSSDDSWYRGRLLDTVTLRKENDVIHEEVSVYFSDYGNTEIVGVANVRQLQPNHYTLPGRANLVLLHGISPVCGVDWDESTCAYFQELVLEKGFFCSSVGVAPSGRSLVKLLDPDDKIFVHDILIRENKAISI